MGLGQKEKWEIIEDHHEKVLPYVELKVLNIEIKSLLRECYRDSLSRFGSQIFAL